MNPLSAPLRRRSLLAGMGAGLAATRLSRPALAQGGAWPNRPVKFIVPYAAGGGTDTLARPWAEKLGQAFGQSFVIDNRGGASGTIGAEAAARSAPDGYTFLFTPNSALNVVPQLRKVNYDALKDLMPVARMGAIVGGYGINASLGITTLAGLVEHARKNPGKIAYGSSGLGTSTHMRLEVLKLRTGADILHVPYRGGADALADVLAGNVHMMNEIVIYPHVKAGKINLLAISHDTRNPDFPAIPTMTELGYPNSDVPIWNSVWAPAGTSREVVTLLNRKIVEIGATAEMRARARDINVALAEGDLTPEGTAAFYAVDTEANAQLIRAAKITLG